MSQANYKLARQAGAGPHIDLDNDTIKDILHVIVGKGLARAKSIMQELSMANRDKKRHLRRLRGEPLTQLE